MSQTQTLTLDQIGVPQELRDRAKILWIMTALWGPFGWAVCTFVWKVPGQEDNPWFMRQLEQAKYIGIIGWVGYVICGLGGLVHLGLGALGFLAVNKGEDYSAPMIAGLVDKKAPAGGSASVGGAGEQRPAPETITQESSTDLLAPVEGVAYQTWAWAWAHISQGHPVEEIIGRVQIDGARWARAHQVWNQRMAQDTSLTILTEFRKYAGAPAAPVQQAAAQQAAAQQAAAQQAAAQQAAAQQAAAQQAAAQQAAVAPASPEPAPIERWVEVAVALEVGQEKGWDSAQLLANFGMSDHDWARVNAWWSQKYRSSGHDQALQARYAQLREYYVSYYSSR